MKITVKEIQDLNSPYLSFVAGDLHAEAYRPWPPEIAPKGALVFVSTSHQFEAALETGAGIIVASKSAFTQSPKLPPDTALFLTQNIQVAMVLLNTKFDTKNTRWPQGISPNAYIDPKAKIGINVSIAPFAVVGENVIIGDHCRIGPNTVIEKNAKIGTNTIMHALVFIGADCEIGDFCEIHPNTTIGSDGFGYAADIQLKDSQHSILPSTNHKIPQLGKVVIEDFVEIGSGVAIDRATLTETRICLGTKLDNLVHIAHNCTVGPNSLLAAAFATAGSSKLGANFKCGGGVRLDSHVTVTDNVMVGGASVITKDIKESGKYVGFPLQPWNDGIRTIASLTSVPEMRKEIPLLKKEIAELKKTLDELKNSAR